ncbi:MAG: TetR/AcrR family transcriptional regulator [Pseudomonadales bacterium]|nr:TetR/AcrR family transcriptional regulator [Pseudomonadales bacterium]MCP5182378.1 TetR/AcrR family transcriptional regulator [Pseudomonadales bacterium]
MARAAEREPGAEARSGSVSGGLRARNKAIVQARILGGAAALIGARGFDAVSMHEIARAAEVSYQTLYNYFPGKAMIAAAFLGQEGERIGNELETLLQKPWPGLLVLTQRANSRLVSLYRPESKRLWQAVMAEFLLNVGEIGSALEQLKAPIVRWWFRVLSEGRRRGELQDNVPLEALTGLLFKVLDADVLQYLLTDESQASLRRRKNADIRLLLGPYLVGS